MSRTEDPRPRRALVRRGRARWLDALIRRFGCACVAAPGFDPPATWTFDAWLAAPRSGDVDRSSLRFRPLRWAARQLGLRSIAGTLHLLRRHGARVVRRREVAEVDVLEVQRHLSTGDDIPKWSRPGQAPGGGG